MVEGHKDIWSSLLHGCEAWTVTAANEKRLEAFEIWCWRRMLRVSWVGRKTNESILEEIGKKREMLRMIRIRQLGFLGHILRKEALENLSLTGKIARSRGRGRPRKKYMDGIRKTIMGGLSIGETLQMTRDRREWKSIIVNVFSDTTRRQGNVDAHRAHKYCLHIEVLKYGYMSDAFMIVMQKA